MALTHAQIIHGLREAAGKWDGEFPAAFLGAFGVSRSTLRLIESRNLARGPNELALPGKIWLRMAETGGDLATALSEIRASSEFIRAKARFAVVADGAHLLAWDDKISATLEIPFAELPENYDFFLPLTGLYEKSAAFEEHPADARACEKMGELYDGILRRNPQMGQHELNVFLTRLLFCFFAEDTGIFPGAKLLTEAIATHTQTDGANLAAFFDELFAALDLPEDSPQRARLPACLAAFPYVNGALFAEKCPAPRFDYRMRYLLLQCGQMKWAEISPAIFGSMFQAVMDVEKRRGLGAHYTSEKNILKVAGPLFLDGLREEFRAIKNHKSGRKAALKEYLRKLASLGFLDPACGCGNFLVVAYRELRELELAALVPLACRCAGRDSGVAGNCKAD